jgi:DNA polymerase-3 subunit epsilon
VQRSFDDLTTPLRDVTFCVLDLETTGGSPQADAITEIGAVKVRGGEVLGTFQTLIDPGLPVPEPIAVLTGITESMLVTAPSVHAVLPALSEFVGGAVLVGHNVRFDAAFLDAALAADGRPRLGIHRVDTAMLARRLLRDDMPNCKLGTLAEGLALDHRPCHRALDDALATVDLLHRLLEQAAGFGVSALDDLLALPAQASHPHAAKLRLTSRLPRAPGIYLFRDHQGRALYAGRAPDLRTRVRSLFASSDGRTIRPLLRQAHTLEHAVCSSGLEAGVLEARLLARLRPRYNRHGTRWRGYRYVKLTHERFPRLTVVRAPRRDGGRYLGPFVSTRAARTVVDAIERAVPLRGLGSPCPPAPQGDATCPSGQIDEAGYARLTEQVVRGLSGHPDELLDPLRRQAQQLLGAGQADEAARVREGAAALAGALRRQRGFDSLQRMGRVVLDLGDDRGAELVRGRLVRAWGPRDRPSAPSSPLAQLVLDDVEAPPADGPPPCDLADELHHVATWLHRNADRVRLVEVDGTFCSPLPRLTLVDTPVVAAAM